MLNKKYITALVKGYINGKNRARTLTLPNGKRTNIIGYLMYHKKHINDYVKQGGQS